MRFSLHIKGTGPLIMHNGRLADPDDPATEALAELTSVRNKTKEIRQLISDAEFRGSLYWDPDAGPYIPGDNIWRSIYDGAKKSKNGENIKQGLIIDPEIYPLAYRGPRGLEDLVRDPNFRFRRTVTNMRARIVRTRAIFRDWALEATGEIDESLVDPKVLVRILEDAGSRVGLGDWRPIYGRYQAVVKSASK
jgi:hypothetical protein